MDGERLSTVEVPADVFWQLTAASAVQDKLPDPPARNKLGVRGVRQRSKNQGFEAQARYQGKLLYRHFPTIARATNWRGKVERLEALRKEFTELEHDVLTQRQFLELT